MTDFEAKPAGFTAVNGKALSPHRPIHNDYRPSSTIDDPSRNTPAANGNSHSRSESGSRPDLRLASRPDERPPPVNTSNFRPSASPAKSEHQVDVTDSDRSPPAKKRTFPEAFDDRPVPGYAPRQAPREGTGVHSPDRYQEIGDQAQQPNSAQAEREGQDFESHTSGPGGSPYSNEGSNDETERRLAAALKGDSIAHDPVRGMYDNQDDEQATPTSAYPTHGDYGTPTRTAAGVAMNADRKRKRVFSNRTKTGCLTCRKRKKKCDELHPECNNCIRGGFVCEGYSSRTNWQRPTPQQKQAPVPLQSKVTGGTYGGTPNRAQHTPYMEATPDFARGPELRPDERPRDIIGPTVTTPKELVPPGAASFQHLPAPGKFVNQVSQAPPRYEPEARPVEPQPEPALHDPSLYPTAPAYPPPPPSQAPPQHQAPLHSAVATAPAPIPPPTAPMHQPTSAVAQAVLQRIPALPPASSLTNTSPPVPPMSVRRTGEPSERDKMLQGDYYLPYTPTLMRDRYQCATALYRFNQACQNPALGFSHLDRERLFSEIVKLRPTPEQSALALGSPVANGTADESNARQGQIIPQGSIGAGCVIEAPFHCDYGYNLNIGADVVIGNNCRITDTCNVTIGNGVVLSPGVTLMCATYAIHPEERRRGKGRALGRAIVIEDEAWIGTNVTILPGVRVGRHSTVGAGSLIHKDVPPYTLIAGNPPKVVRGIGGMEESRSG